MEIFQKYNLSSLREASVRFMPMQDASGAIFQENTQETIKFGSIMHSEPKSRMPCHTLLPCLSSSSTSSEPLSRRRRLMRCSAMAVVIMLLCSCTHDASAGKSTNTTTVTLNPGDDIQAAVDASPAGTLVLLSPGIYRMQSVTPKDGNIFDGRNDAVLNGSRELTGFVQRGSMWFVGGQAQEGDVTSSNDYPICQRGSPRCNRPEDLFIDNEPMLHVSSLSAVGPGRWFFDYATNRIYIGDNPAGKKIETSVTPIAFHGTASNVVIKNLTIEKYATPIGEAAIGAHLGDNWTVQDSTIRLNHSIGIDFDNKARILRNRINRNGMAGYAGGGADFLFEGNEVGHNNFAGVNREWEAGGGKVTEAPSGGVIRNNCIHNNQGNGIWMDVNANGIIIENNVVWGNSDSGIMYEISYDGIIRNNIVAYNGHRSKTWGWNPQILVSSSRGVKIYRNFVDTSAGYGNAITVVSQDREQYTPAIGNEIYENTITIRSKDFGKVGLFVDVEQDLAAASTQNRFYRNTYYVKSLHVAHWEWSGRPRTFAQMRRLGQEQDSTIASNLPAKPQLNCDFLQLRAPGP
jgi:parallel beta-helix repeat protein